MMGHLGTNNNLFVANGMFFNPGALFCYYGGPLSQNQVIWYVVAIQNPSLMIYDIVD